MKSNTNAIRKQIRNVILNFCSNVNYRKIPQPASYPYTTFLLQELQTEYGKTQCRLEINCVSKNAEEVEQLADNIQDKLDGYSYLDDKTSFEVYRLQRDIIEEEDKDIERRRLTFELNYYKRED